VKTRKLVPQNGAPVKRDALATVARDRHASAVHPQTQWQWWIWGSEGGKYDPVAADDAE